MSFPIIIDIIGYFLMTIPYLFWDYDDAKQSKVIQVLRRREEVTGQTHEDGEVDALSEEAETETEVPV